jgi:hypothetical protein
MSKTGRSILIAVSVLGGIGLLAGGCSKAATPTATDATTTTTVAPTTTAPAPIRTTSTPLTSREVVCHTLAEVNWDARLGNGSQLEPTSFYVGWKRTGTLLMSEMA